MQNQARRIADRDGTVAIERDDYLVIGDVEPDRPSVAVRIVHGLQVLLILLMAVLSFAVFWVVGLMLHIF
jgi:hypothetical protein